MMLQWLGSILFTTLMFVSVAVYGPLVILCRPLGYACSYAVARNWCALVLVLLRRLCRLDYVVSGREHLAATSTVILMKHSSSWETIAQLILFPRQTWVLKRELIWAPVLGWGISCLKPIAIDRKGGRAAVEQVIARGRQRLAEGLWIVIFPEGTRVPAGQTKRYGLSGALLAQAAGRAVVPVAHNAGQFWPRRSLLKRRGTIHVVIGEPIATAGREPRAINQEVQAWIEQELRAMSAARS